jgi:hypothetical protein
MDFFYIFLQDYIKMNIILMFITIIIRVIVVVKIVMS